MLAYYTSIVKRDELLRRILTDAEDLAELANDLICEVKAFSAASVGGTAENAIVALKQADDKSKMVTTMCGNLKSNYEAYLLSLLPQELDNKKEEPKEQEVPKPDQLASVIEAVKTLKEMEEKIRR